MLSWKSAWAAGNSRAPRKYAHSKSVPSANPEMAAIALGALLLFVYQRGHSIFPHSFAALPEGQNTQELGIALYGNYMLPFEIASLLLLVAIVGAVVMAKKRI